MGIGYLIGKRAVRPLRRSDPMFVAQFSFLRQLFLACVTTACGLFSVAALPAQGPAGKDNDTLDRARQSLTSQETNVQLREGIKKRQNEAGHLSPESAADRTNATANRLAENRQLQSERERRTNDALRAVDRTALAPRSDFELPKDWKARTQTRKGSNDISLSVKERTILRKLDSTLSPSFKNSRFEDVIDYLQTVTGLPIAVHTTALEEAGVSYDTPVTLQVKGITVRSVLRKILADLGLAYVIKDEAVQVVTAQQARDMLTVRV